MKTKGLNVGDRVHIVLPYDAGRGSATIVALNVTPGQWDRLSCRIFVSFDGGSTARNLNTPERGFGRFVAPAWIVKKLEG